MATKAADEKLFEGGRIFDGWNPPLEHHALLIRDGRVVRLAPAGEFGGYAGPRENLEGKTLLPGIIDCHVHLFLAGQVLFGFHMMKDDPDDCGEPCSMRMMSARFSRNYLNLERADLALAMLENAQANLRGGVTSVRDMCGKDNYEMQVRDAIAAGQHLGPTVSCAGKGITITGGHGWWSGREADGAEDMRRAVRENIKAGADFVKFVVTGGILTMGTDPNMTAFTQEEVEAGIGEALRLGKKAAAHAQGADGIARAVRAGATSIEHGFDLRDEVIADMIRRGVWLVPTLAIPDAFRENGSGFSTALREKGLKFADIHVDSVKRYYRAGGKIAMGTDTGFPYIYHGNNCRELSLMRSTGMAEIDVLRISTSNAAELCGFADRGRLAEGNWADLLVVNGNPFDDIERVADRRHHHAVYKNGFDVHSRIGRERARPWPTPFAR